VKAPEEDFYEFCVDFLGSHSECVPMALISLRIPLFVLFSAFINSQFVLGWDKVECELLEDAYRDGDSFHVKVLKGANSGQEKIFRLYFVDAPEVSADFPAQVASQLEDFGCKDEVALLSAGQAAREFTERLLRGNRFEVWTCWEDARGNSSLPRYYGVVRVGTKSLCEELVRNGLARAYGRSYLPSGDPKEPFSSTALLERYRESLRGLQSDALRRKVGAFSKTRLVLRPGEVVPQREYVDYEAELSEEIFASGLEDILRVPGFE